MVREASELTRQWASTWDHLGTNFPYYFNSEEPRRFYFSIGEALANQDSQKLKIDPVGILQMLSRSYMFGDRTLIDGLRMCPWMARPTEGNGWCYADVPRHGNAKVNPRSIAITLLDALESEMVGYIGDIGSVGILLSGGLDSRIVAGVLRKLQLEKVFNGDVLAMTWGIEGTRDVEYAKAIASRFGWEWQHYAITAENLRQNIIEAGKAGAEFAPLHLHAMPMVKKARGIDMIVAATYGDGIGKAKYSGRDLTKLAPTIPRSPNRYGLVQCDVVSSIGDKIANDVYAYRSRVPRSHEYEYRECEQQIHYLRRKLNPCMMYMNQELKVVQAFTSPQVFSLMWSIDPVYRNSEIYYQLLRLLPGDLGSIPESASGLRVGAKHGIPDQMPQVHHRYGIWLRRELQGFVERLVMQGPLLEIGIFNESAVRRLMRIWPKACTITTNSIDEIVSWLASFSVFLTTYGITGVKCSYVRPKLADSWRAFVGPTEARVYQIVRERFRE